MNKEEFNNMAIGAQVQEVNATGGPAAAGKVIGIAASTIKGRFSSNGYIRDEKSGCYHLKDDKQFPQEDIVIKNMQKPDEGIKEMQKETTGNNTIQEAAKINNNNTKETKKCKSNLMETIASLPSDNETNKISFRLPSSLSQQLDLFFQKNCFLKKQDILTAAVKDLLDNY
jgi:hypothetical protein